MHKIRQRFSLVHHSGSTLTIETQTKQQKHTKIIYMNNNQTSKRSQLSKHKKKRSLGDAFFKHLPKLITNPDDQTHDEDANNFSNHRRSKSHGNKKRNSFTHGIGIGIGNKKRSLLSQSNKSSKRNKLRKGSANSDDTDRHNNDIIHLNDTDHDNNNHNAPRLHFPRSQSIGAAIISSLPEAEEDVADFGLDLEDDEYDPYNRPPSAHQTHFSFSSSSPRSPVPKLKKSQSNDSLSINVNHGSANNSGYLPPPQSPHQKHVEHEKFTLIEQMRQLQKSMTQLGEMLNDQDKNLMVEKKKNEKLTEQVNNLADENMALRQQIHRHRQDRNTVWQDLEFYKLAAQQHRDKNLILANQISVMTQQKADLSTYSAGLLEQLTAERKKTQRLTLKIRKYSKNVKSLHKKTHSLSGLQRYHNQYNHGQIKLKQPQQPQSRVTAIAPKQVKFIKSNSDPISLSTPTQLAVVEDNTVPESKKDVDTITNDHLQQKRQELQELEQQTLQILEQLQQETKQLLGETQGLSKRSEKRLRHNNGTTKRSKKKRKENIQNKAEDDIIITTKTETKTKTKTKTKTTIKGDKITTSKIETKKTKTKTTTQQQARKCSDSDKKMKKEEEVEDVEGEVVDNDDLKTGSNSSSNSNSSDDDEDDGDDEVEFYSDEEDEGHVDEHMAAKKRESIDLNEEEKEVIKDTHRFHIQSASIDDEEEDVDKASTIKQHKEEVEMLKKTDAPLSLLFQAFEAQMDAEEDTEADTESENEQPEPINAADVTSKRYSNVTDDSPTVFEQFANFNGFSDDEDEEITDSLQALWN